MTKPGKQLNRNKTTSMPVPGSSFFTFTLIITALLIYDVILTSDDNFNVEAIKNDLLNNVHNQTEPVYVILESLSNMYHHKQGLNIVNFIGTSGVGKTFIANILKSHFHPVYEINGPLKNNFDLNFSSKIKESHSKYNLIVVDDLTVVDVDNLVKFLKKISPEFVALVICIFNIQETDNELNYVAKYENIDNITKKFKDSSISHTVAKFHEFDRSQASTWVMQQFQNKGMNPQLHISIIESILNNQNIKNHGLKGLSSKINLEL